MKTLICTTCKIEKSVDEFQVRKDKPKGYMSSCKKCNAERSLIYNRTKIGVLSKIYYRQCGASKTRGHEQPKYTKQELIEWATRQDLFYKIYIEWVGSNYEYNKIPSIDRIDNSKGYSFDNIRLSTWKENKYAWYTYEDKMIKTRKKVLQYDINMNLIATYESQVWAAMMNNTTQGNISCACLGKIKTLNGYIFKHE